MYVSERGVGESTSYSCIQSTPVKSINYNNSGTLVGAVVVLPVVVVVAVVHVIDVVWQLFFLLFCFYYCYDNNDYYNDYTTATSHFFAERD